MVHKDLKIQEHRDNTIKSIKKLLETEDRVACVRPTGYGKSYIINNMINSTGGKCILVEPQVSIIDYIERHITTNNVDKCTYSSLMYLKDSEDVINKFGVGIDYIFLDEMHRAGADKWGKSVELLINTYNCKVIGLSATPVRMDGQDIVDVLFRGNQVEPLTLAQAILDGLYPIPRIITALYTLETEVRERISSIEKSKRLTEDKKLEIIEELDNVVINLNKMNNIPSILRKHMETHAMFNNHMKFMVFCASIESIKQDEATIEKWFTEAFPTKTINVHSVHSGMDDSRIEYEINRFEKQSSLNSINIMLSVNMFNEGVHLKGITGIMMLRRTESSIIYLQQLGRTLRASAKYQPIIFDFVNNHKYLRSGIVSLIEQEYRGRAISDISIDLAYEDIGINVFDYANDILKILNNYNLYSKWEEWEDNLIISTYSDGGIQSCFKALPSRTKASIKYRVFILGLSGGNAVWSKEDDRVVKSNYPKYGLAKCLELLPNKNKYAIQYRVRQLGIKSSNIGSRWEDWEDKILHAYYEEYGSSECLKYLTNRTDRGVCKRARKLGLNYKHVGKVWEEWEDIILKEVYPSHGLKGCSERLTDRTKSQISNRVKVLKLKRSTN